MLTQPHNFKRNLSHSLPHNHRLIHFTTLHAFFCVRARTLRLLGSSSFLRRRRLPDVISTSSSSWMYDRADSSVTSSGGTRRTNSSLPAARILVRCLALTGLTSRSSSRECSPTTMPLYTFMPGAMKRRPRGSISSSAYDVQSPVAMLMREPLRVVSMGPRCSLYSTKRCWRMPVPRVSCLNSRWKPMRPRVGMVKTRRARLSGSSSNFIMSPLRLVSFSMALPVCSMFRSSVTSSMGSSCFPSTSWKSTRGGDTETSYPSRRIDSSRMHSCSSPRPRTSMESAERRSTWIETLLSASVKRRSAIWLDVRKVPSRPARGDELTEMVMAMVGGSMGAALIGSVTSGWQSVSLTVEEGRPASVMMSPASAEGMMTCSMPWRANSFSTRASTRFSPDSVNALMVSPVLTRPDTTRPIRHLPRNELASNCVTSMRKGESRSTFGGGMYETMASNSGVIEPLMLLVSFTSLIDVRAQPPLAEA
eukprot:m.165877 g.165877  ORF g.165877 m.165877 type:complete len:478 (-) comp17162_c0_seq14:759-2192(-)